MKASPCKTCDHHDTYCHSGCELYLEWSSNVRKERIHTSKERAALDAMWNYNGRKRKK